MLRRLLGFIINKDIDGGTIDFIKYSLEDRAVTSMSLDDFKITPTH